MYEVMASSHVDANNSSNGSGMSVMSSMLGTHNVPDVRTSWPLRMALRRTKSPRML